MSLRILFPHPAVASALCLALLAGCGGDDNANSVPSENGDAEVSQTPEQAHDPHDVPLTEQEIAQLKAETAQYSDAIDHIRQYRETIQQETTQGDPAKAHRALDKLEVVLQRLPEAARDSGVPKEKWQEVNETAQKLRELFNQVHANIDAGENPNYEAVSQEVDQSIETLAAIEPEKAK